MKWEQVGGVGYVLVVGPFRLTLSTNNVTWFLSVQNLWLSNIEMDIKTAQRKGFGVADAQREMLLFFRGKLKKAIEDIDEVLE